MTESVVTIPHLRTSDEGDELLAKARRICRTLVESLSSPDARDESTSTNFVLYLRNGHTRFIQTVPAGTALQHVLNAITDTAATPFVVVTEAMLLDDNAGPSRQQFMFHLCEPSGAQAIHLCNVDPTTEGVTLGATTIVRPGQTAAIHYRTDQKERAATSTFPQGVRSSRLLN